MGRIKSPSLEKAVSKSKPAPRVRRKPDTEEQLLSLIALMRRYLKASAGRKHKRRRQALAELRDVYLKRLAPVKRLADLRRALRRVGSAAKPPTRKLDDFSEFLGKPASNVPWEPFYKSDKFTRTRRTGGIREQRAMVMNDNSVRFEVGGELQESIGPIRKKLKHPDGTHKSMDYSTEGGSLRNAKQRRYDGKNLVDAEGKSYERAHLWGHGFGDEARAGIMYAPSEVNQTLQRSGIEGFLIEQAGEGGNVTVVASARSHPPKKPFSGLAEEERGEFVLRHLKYEFKVTRADGTSFTATMEFDIPTPPGKPVEIGGSMAGLFD